MIFETCGHSYKAYSRAFVELFKSISFKSVFTLEHNEIASVAPSLKLIEADLVL